MTNTPTNSGENEPERQLWQEQPGYIPHEKIMYGMRVA